MFYNDQQKREILMQHYLKPNNKVASIAENKIEKFGETCSDHLQLNLKIDNNQITELNFAGAGCVFFLASTDLLIDRLKGLNISQAQELLMKYELMINQELDLNEANIEFLNKLLVFENIKVHQNRINCVLMLPRAIKQSLTNV